MSKATNEGTSEAEHYSPTERAELRRLRAALAHGPDPHGPDRNDPQLRHIRDGRTLIDDSPESDNIPPEAFEVWNLGPDSYSGSAAAAVATVATKPNRAAMSQARAAGDAPP